MGASGIHEKVWDMGEGKEVKSFFKKYLEDAIASTENQDLEVPLLTWKCPINKLCLYQDDPVSMGLNWRMMM